MANLYLFHYTHKKFFVIEDTWKAARNKILQEATMKNAILTNLKGKRIRSACETEAKGIVSVDYVFENLAWWKCRCENTAFIPLDNGSACRCTQCGREIRLYSL